MIRELTMRQKEIYEFHHKHGAEGAMMEYGILKAQCFTYPTIRKTV